MNRTHGSSRLERPGARLEHWLASLLHYGTWIATGTIAAGLAFTLRTQGGAGPATIGASVMTAGIALFILLPIMRLILMLGVFLHQRDYRFGAIAALVLAIVAAGLLVGAA
ncbi:DUF1634 domain-containing protein [Paraburkholderia fynbosensis]|uniref:DUF1634 domain-containing protein n=1 Tax=Paraburkholderia fynbosensis TaxID=1200993 RepID=A0A6J5FVV8_9BURK|nr:DUF1634 domain-containing protein [Paraburkholderia fynbosensis]CAB3788420.1 hypothetical protein LMG27177_02410 [Paraburkholderia fynbosensis]